MTNEYHSAGRGWRDKFRDAFRGLAIGIAGQSSFRVHFAMAAVVLVVSAVLRVSTVEWCLVIGCVVLVLTAELFNSALEKLAKAVDTKHNPLVGSALDIGSGAVLVASIGSAVTGGIILLPKLIALFFGVR